MALIAVFGGAGYIGSHMVKALVRAGHAVTVFDNLSTGHADAVRGAALVRGDLRRREDVEAAFAREKFDAVMHFAACCYVGESVLEPRKYYDNNVTGTLHLLDAMAAAGVRRLVFSSSCATYGFPRRLPIDERWPSLSANPSAPVSGPSLERISSTFGACSRIGASFASPCALVTSALAPEFCRR